MSPANNAHSPLPTVRLALRHQQRGFSLTELLVAMAIFITLMSGIAALFVGSVDTVRQGYQSIEAYESGRSVLAVMERDLKSSFTSRELGQFYQFYGNANGFTFIGGTGDGQLQRVSYVLHPLVQQQIFASTIPANDAGGGRTDVMNRIATQAQDRARDAGYNEADQSNYADLVLSLMPPPIIDSGDIPHYRVRVRTGAILRYAETGQSDLDSFKLPGDMEWPVLNPSVYGNDSAAPEGSSQSLLYFLQLAVNPDPSRPETDLRSYVSAGPALGLRALNPRAIDAMIAARRREFWLTLLSSDLPPANFPSFWPAQVGAAVIPANDFAITSDVVISADLLDANGDIIFLPAPITSFSGEPIPLNALYIGGIFNYSNFTDQRDSSVSSQHSVPTFNDNDNIQGYNRTPDPANSNISGYMQDVGNDYDDAALRLDLAMQSLLGGAQRATNSAVGNPLSPRLPGMVQVGFHIMKPRTRVGGPDLRRWFTQGIDIPTAQNRDLPTTLIPTPGSS